MMDYRESSPTDPGDDAFMNDLIDAVQRNPCVYNRYDPLHKMSDYKHEVWKLITQEMKYDGQPVELERKWRHMRDKYVRLRKQDKLSAPIKKNNKWYPYYMKMSFLDPYVEHRNRNRKKQKEGGGGDEIDDKYDSWREEPEFENENLTFSTSDALSRLYETFLSDTVVEADVDVKPDIIEEKVILSTTSSSSSSASASASAPRSPSVIPISRNGGGGEGRSEGSSYTHHQQGNHRNRKRQHEMDSRDELETVDREDESEVSLFVRSIAKSLESMDRRSFAMARIEIAKVLFNCQYGSLEQPAV